MKKNNKKLSKKFGLSKIMYYLCIIIKKINNMKTKFNEKDNTIMIQCVKHARKSPIWVDIKNVDMIQHKNYIYGPFVYLKNEKQSFIQIKDFYIGDYNTLLDMIDLLELHIDSKIIHGRWWINFKNK